LVKKLKEREVFFGKIYFLKSENLKYFQKIFIKIFFKKIEIGAFENLGN
jgi:hypothetical protein